MKKTAIALLLAACTTAGVHAQSTPTNKEHMATDGTCLGLASSSTWEELGLTPEQTKRVTDIQMRCNKEMEMHKDMGADGKMVDKYEGELKAVLTDPQFEQYKAWCAGRSQKPMEKTDR
ncbi:MAG: hypothetical protein H6595_09830 [Flavobacteriales bacterium]|nr:hypothetical protein [Flavobacteriales bacterium]MCB9167760.1 hypothetical protein [Flavobacteriales bacterium]